MNKTHHQIFELNPRRWVVWARQCLSSHPLQGGAGSIQGSRQLFAISLLAVGMSPFAVDEGFNLTTPIGSQASIL